MKSKQTGKTLHKQRNPVALNPLMQRSSAHTHPKNERRKERTRIKRDLKKGTHEFNHARGGSDDKSSHWQNTVMQLKSMLTLQSVLPVARLTIVVQGSQTLVANPS